MMVVFARSSTAASPCTDTIATTPRLSRLPSLATMLLSAAHLAARRLLRITSSSAPEAAARRLSPSLPGDLVGVNKDSYFILDTLPSEYDSRVKAMEVDEKPTEDYNDIGGLEKQIQELVEAIVLPMTLGRH